MLVIIIMIVSLIGSLILLGIGANSYDNGGIFITLALVLLSAFVGLCIYGGFHGLINYPKTEGTHTGMVSAVDLNGVYFRRYDVYLKVSEFTVQEDETTYRLYENEKELAEKLKNAVGKQVKISYGHDGGYIGWKSCGTYHIKSVEILEDKIK